MIDVTTIVNDIVTHPAPVVFLDTCAILDVARASARSQSDSVSAATDLVALAARNPPGIHLLVVDLVLREWNDGIGTTSAEVARSIGTYRDVVRTALEVGEMTDFVSPDGLLGLAEKLRGRSEALLKACRQVARDSVATSAAFDRVVQLRRPSHKRQIKDSYILEHCLAVSRTLRASGFQEPLLFVSSNLDDFAIKTTRTLHPELQDDFNSVQLQYAVTIGSALATLRGGGKIV